MARTVMSTGKTAAARSAGPNKNALVVASKMPRPTQAGKMPVLTKTQAAKVKKAAAKLKSESKIDRLNAKVPLEGKKKRRISHEKRADKEIKKYQKSYELLTKEAPMSRLCHEIGSKTSVVPLRWQRSAVTAIREATEAYLNAVFTLCQRLTLFAGQKTVMPKTMAFAMQTFKDFADESSYSGPLASEFFALGGGRVVQQLRGTAQALQYTQQIREANAAKKAAAAAKRAAKAAKAALKAAEEPAEDAADEQLDSPPADEAGEEAQVGEFAGDE